MIRDRRKGAPNRQVQGAANGRRAEAILTDKASVRELARKEAMRTGFFLGLGLGLLVLCAVLMFWAVPTTDAAVQAAREIQAAAS